MAAKHELKGVLWERNDSRSDVHERRSDTGEAAVEKDGAKGASGLIAIVAVVVVGFMVWAVFRAKPPNIMPNGTAIIEPAGLLPNAPALLAPR